MANIVVYTAIFSGYDVLRPVQLPSAARFVCFTDQDVRADGWEVVRVPACGDPRKQNRQYKTQPALVFPDADFTVYVDGNLLPTVAPELMVNEWLNGTDIAAFAHPLRDCIYQEAEAVLAKAKAPAEDVRAQMAAYREAGYPEHYGLSECTMLVRAQSDAMERLGRLWWEQLCTYTVRDQLSFNYCLWRLSAELHVVPGYVRRHPWFDCVRHWGR